MKNKKLNIMTGGWYLLSAASGAYVGYLEGKGIDTSKEKSYLLKLGPTALASAISPTLLYIGLKLFKYGLSKAPEFTKNMPVDVNEKSVRLDDLVGEERIAKEAELNEELNVISECLKEINFKKAYIKEAAKSGGKTLLATALGYGLGRLASNYL